ncbi:mechanosensitive ion channel domain-containing protein [Rubritalea spongiae]|uniref:Mechanosensitive ion channel domain-containing protein n=1 Tax=Rubritalea spongiae TaxID=430797 RepID=A0ABW5DYA1_9BACT
MSSVTSNKTLHTLILLLVCSLTSLAQTQKSDNKALVSETIDAERTESLESSVIEDIKTTEQKIKKTQAQLDLVTNYRANAEKRIQLIESAGLSIDAKTGQLLRQQRSQLPTVYSLKQQLDQVNVEITNAEITLLDLSNSLEPHHQDTDTLEANYEKYISKLDELAKITRETLNTTQSYTYYLDERLLWIPSIKPVQLGEFKTELSAIIKLFSPSSLESLFKSLRRDIIKSPLLWIAVLFPLIILFFFTSKIKRALEKLASRAQHRDCLTIAPSFFSTVLSLLLSQLLPLALFFLAWRCDSPVNWSSGFFAAAISVSLLSFLNIIATQYGLLESHFGTEKHKTKLLHFHTAWALVAIPSLLFLSYSLHSASMSPTGRISFMLAMALCLYFAHSLLKPSKRLLASEHTPNWLLKTLYSIGVLTPLIYLLGYAIGYIASVQTLLDHTVITIVFIASISIFARLSSRWVLISRRNFAKHQARKKHEALKAEQGSKNSNDIPSIEEIEANSVDIQAIATQTKSIIRFLTTVISMIALWNIWSPVLPAFTALDNVTVVQSHHPAYSSDAQTEENSSSANSNPVSSITSATQSSDDNSTFFSNSISLGDIIGAILIIAFTLVAAKNIPGLLELSVLRRINLKPGGNYAITTVSRYLIITSGILAAFAQVGVTWSSVKWLAAAVTLGIGFGLQEIFANFVAGLIILFERPVRLGDIVTIGDVTGRVSQIKIRATTIQQFNNRELLVPNKEFITGQLINWSLCDNTLRFEIPIGIAYGSDTQKATEILHEIISKHPHVLKDPEPDVLFQEFGASSLNFVLRGFVNHYQYLLSTQSELHYQIDEAFREASIEIAFPQTDIHIKSLPAKALEDIPEQQ